MRLSAEYGKKANRMKRTKQHINNKIKPQTTQRTQRRTIN